MEVAVTDGLMALRRYTVRLGAATAYWAQTAAASAFPIMRGTRDTCGTASRTPNSPMLYLPRRERMNTILGRSGREYDC